MKSSAVDVNVNSLRAVNFDSDPVFGEFLEKRAGRIIDPLVNSEVARLEGIVAQMRKAVSDVQAMRMEVASYREVTLRLAMEVGALHKMGLLNRPGAIEGKHIIMATSSAFGVPIDKLLGSERPNHIAFPRMAAMWVMREKLEMALMDIGQIFNKDHGTVLHAVKRVPKIAKADRLFAENLNKVIVAFNWEERE